MITSFRAQRTVNRHYKRKTIQLNYDQLMSLLEKHLSWSPQQIEVQQFLERPFSLILKMAVRNRLQESYFVKLYKVVDLPRQRFNIKKEYAISRYWFEKFKPNVRFQVIEPLWLDEQHLIIVTRESPGKNLLSLTNTLRLLPSNSWLSKVLHFIARSGEWLKIFQSFPTDDDVPYLEKPVAVSLAYLQEYLLIRMQKMVKNPHIAFDASWQEKILAYLQNQWQQVGPKKDALCFTHTDFSLSNVLVSQNRVTILDFGKCEINSPYKDLARFYHQLYLLGFKPSFQKQVVCKMQQAFLDGYGDPQADQHPLFKIFFLIHQVTHLGKISRFWEHGLIENVYNRYLAKQVLKDLKETVQQ